MRTTTTERKDTASVITDRICDLLDQGIVPWKPCVMHPNTALALPINGATGRQYNGINILMLLSQTMAKGYNTNRWYTIPQLNKLGARVTKGEKGMPVIKPFDVESKDPDGNLLYHKDGSVRKHMVMTYRWVFNGNQTNLVIEEPDRHVLDPALRHGAANDALMSYVEREGITLTHNGDGAYYTPAIDRINLPDFRLARSPARWFEAAFHEAVHSTGHSTRLARITGMAHFDQSTEDYAREELVAELGAAYLLAEHGIFEEQAQNLAEYIRNWTSRLRNDRQMIFAASSKASKAVAFIKGAKT